MNTSPMTKHMKRDHPLPLRTVYFVTRLLYADVAAWQPVRHATGLQKPLRWRRRPAAAHIRDPQGSDA